MVWHGRVWWGMVGGGRELGVGLDAGPAAVVISGHMSSDIGATVNMILSFDWRGDSPDGCQLLSLSHHEMKLRASSFDFSCPQASNKGPKGPVAPVAPCLELGSRFWDLRLGSDGLRRLHFNRIYSEYSNAIAYLQPCGHTNFHHSGDLRSRVRGQTPRNGTLAPAQPSTIHQAHSAHRRAL
jgi:hypothetical protein